MTQSVCPQKEQDFLILSKPHRLFLTPKIIIYEGVIFSHA
jgi:hypothetical protein